MVGQLAKVAIRGMVTRSVTTIAGVRGCHYDDDASDGVAARLMKDPGRAIVDVCKAVGW